MQPPAAPASAEQPYGCLLPAHCGSATLTIVQMQLDRAMLDSEVVQAINGLHEMGLVCVPLLQCIAQHHAAGCIGCRQQQQARLALPRCHQIREGSRKHEPAHDCRLVKVQGWPPGCIIHRCSKVVGSKQGSQHAAHTHPPQRHAAVARGRQERGVREGIGAQTCSGWAWGTVSSSKRVQPRGAQGRATSTGKKRTRARSPL